MLVPEAHDTQLDWSVLRNMNTDMLLMVLAFAIIATAVFRAMSAYLSLVGLSVAASRIIAEIRADLYAHIQRLSLSFRYAHLNQYGRGDVLD